MTKPKPCLLQRAFSGFCINIAPKKDSKSKSKSAKSGSSYTAELDSTPLMKAAAAHSSTPPPGSFEIYNDIAELDSTPLSKAPAAPSSTPPPRSFEIYRDITEDLPRPSKNFPWERKHYESSLFEDDGETESYLSVVPKYFHNFSYPLNHQSSPTTGDEYKTKEEDNPTGSLISPPTTTSAHNVSNSVNSWDAFRSEPLFDEFYATIWCPIYRSRVPIPDESPVFRNTLLNAFLDRATYLHFLHDGINLGKLYEWMPQELWEEIFSEDERVQIILNCRNRLNSSIEQGISEVLGEWVELDDFPEFPTNKAFTATAKRSRTAFFYVLLCEESSDADRWIRTICKIYEEVIPFDKFLKEGNENKRREWLAKKLAKRVEGSFQSALSKGWKG